MHLHPQIENAYKVLDGKMLSREEALTLAKEINGHDIVDLISLANKVKDRFAEPMLRCSILNAKSGVCSQNCKFCAQSGHYNTAIESYPILPVEEVVAAAKIVYDSGVRAFGYVTSGYGYLTANEEFNHILATLDAVHEAFPDLYLCVSIGILSDETARLLSLHHTNRYNMNLQTSPARYKELIADTHGVDEKIQTIRHLQKYGVHICCGGILGLGENWTDRIDMALAIRELNVEGSPLNVLLPIPGTPVESVPLVSPAEVAKFFALFRLINPDGQIRFAAGRESRMKDYQALLMLSGLNGVITGGYLTTRGRSVAEDELFLAELADFSTI